MRILITISNHPVSGWSKEQKAGWDSIIEIPFPNVPAGCSDLDVFTLSSPIIGQIEQILSEKNDCDSISLHIQGESSLCFEVFRSLTKLEEGIVQDDGTWSTECPINFTFPTTERVSVEKDGVKSSVFKFVQWRTMY